VGEYPESYPALGNWPGYGYVTPPPGEPPAPSDPVPPASPPPGNRKWLWVALTLAALLVLVVIGAGLAWTAQTISSRTSTTTDTSTNAAPPTMFAPPPMSPPLCPPAVAGPLTPAGWQPVSSPVGLAYDVPADWKVNDCSTMLGWEKYCAGGPFGTCPIEVLNGSAELSDPLCPTGWRAVAGLDRRTDSKDIGREARAKSSLVGDIYTSESGRKPTVSLGDPRTMTIDGAPAVEVLATVTHIEQDECHGPGALHSVVATSGPGGEGVVVLVVSIGQGYAGAPDAGLIDQVIGTLRHN
jgi:hypothetical protein